MTAPSRAIALLSATVLSAAFAWLPTAAWADSTAAASREEAADDVDGANLVTQASSEQLDAETSFPSLAEAIRRAQERAPEVARARGAQRAGEARRVGARFAPLANPTIELFLDRGNQGQTRDVAVAGYVWLPLELSGQRRKRITEAESFIEWTQANAVAAQAAAAGEAVAHYGACMVAAARVESFTALQTIAEEQNAFFRKRHDQGDATRQEWKIAESELARVQALLQETQADLARATAALSSLLGEPIGPPPTREAWGAGRAQPIAKWRAAATSAEGATRGSVDAATAAEAPALSALLEQAPLLQALRQERAFFKASAARARRSAQEPVNLIVSAGRGDFGETRLGGGLAWALPTLRRGQDEAAVLLA